MDAMGKSPKRWQKRHCAQIICGDVVFTYPRRLPLALSIPDVPPDALYLALNPETTFNGHRRAGEQGVLLKSSSPTRRTARSVSSVGVKEERRGTVLKPN